MPELENKYCLNICIFSMNLQISIENVWQYIENKNKQLVANSLSLFLQGRKFITGRFFNFTNSICFGKLDMCFCKLSISLGIYNEMYVCIAFLGEVILQVRKN